MTLNVPGIIYEEFIEDSQVPTRHKISKGYRMRYDATTEQRESILWHIETMAGWSGGFEPGDRGKDAGHIARKWLEGLDQ